jgi:phosphoribosylanthranilate isomerase
VGVFVNQPVEEIISLLNDGIIDIAQLHGGEGEADILAIREATGKPAWKAFRIRSAQDVENARNSPADLVLLDNGYGTGESFDWRLVGEFSRPFGLAGGLTPENLPQAIAQINPTLVDLSSGIETNKQKDLKKMLRAVAATHSIERN